MPTFVYLKRNCSDLVSAKPLAVSTSRGYTGVEARLDYSSRMQYSNYPACRHTQRSGWTPLAGTHKYVELAPLHFRFNYQITQTWLKQVCGNAIFSSKRNNYTGSTRSLWHAAILDLIGITTRVSKLLCPLDFPDSNPEF